MDFFKALGNEKRQEILIDVFADRKEHNVSEIARRCKIAQSTASEHLSFLKRAGILTSKKIEKEVYYAVNRDRILSILDYVKNNVVRCC